MNDWEELHKAVYNRNGMKEGVMTDVNLKDFSDLIKKYSQNPDVVETLRHQLHRQNWRLALEVASYLSEEDKKELFSEIFFWSMHINGIDLVNSIVNTLPRTWVVTRLETELEDYLGDSATDDEYRMMLHFASSYDLTIARQVMKRALSHSDQHIRDVGEDFTEYLKF